MKTTIAVPLVAGLIATTSPLTSLAEDTDALIAAARSAAPPAISADATVMYRGEVLVEGSNGWTCLPEVFPDDNSPICNDATWMAMMQAMGGKEAFEASTIGISYMLQGDGGVSNSDPFHADPMHADDFIKEGPHLMIIVPKAVLEGMTDDPASGQPYVMWGDTDYAHIMVPVAERP